MKINKDLIIEDSNISLDYIATNIDKLIKLLNKKQIFSGSVASGGTITLSDGLKWSDLGHFKNLIVIIQYSPTNVTTNAIFPYESICNAGSEHLMDKRRVTNCQAALAVDGARYATFIPSSAIGEKTIALSIAGVNGCNITGLFIEY